MRDRMRVLLHIALHILLTVRHVRVHVQCTCERAHTHTHMPNVVICVI